MGLHEIRVILLPSVEALVILLIGVRRDTFFYEINVMEEYMKKALLFLGVSILTLVLAACQTEEDTFVVGMECNYAPFNWTTSEAVGQPIEGVDAYCDGYDVAVAELLAEELGLNLVVRKIDWDGLIPALTSGTIDAIIAGMSPTAERAEVILFSDPYFESEQVLVVSTDSPYLNATSLSDLSGASVIAQQGTLQNDLITQIPNVNQLNPLTDYPSLVAQVSSGIADAFIAEWPVATAIIASNDDLAMVRLTENGFVLEPSDVTTAVAVRLSETDLRDQINEILASLTVAEREALMSEALNNQPE